MGYYANGGGNVVFRRELTGEELVKLQNVLEDAWFEYDFDFREAKSKTGTHQGEKYTEVQFWQDEKYHREEVEGVLYFMKALAPIREGCIEYAGEDGDHWRFIYRNDAWKEQAGHIVYDED